MTREVKSAIMASDQAQNAATMTASPYQLDLAQIQRASTALLKNVQQHTKRLQEESSKRNLLAKTEGDDDSENEADGDETPVWLSLTTKQHIVDKKRLKPSKIKVPHPINTAEDLTICLITVDPQSQAKAVLEHPSFPTKLATRITKVIGLSKLKAKYSQFEARRQLRDEHDIFIADDRIFHSLTGTLGKIFYKGTTKRPIPVNIAPRETDADGKRIKKEKKTANVRKERNNDERTMFAPPMVVAKEIETAINSVPVSIKPGTNVAIRVGRTSFTPDQVAENVQTVATSVIERHVVKGWRNVKAIHLKTPRSPALPIWNAPDLWVDAEKVDENEDYIDAEKEGRDATPKKRKAIESSDSPANTKMRKSEESALAAIRKAKLTKQKAEVLKQAIVA